MPNDKGGSIAEKIQSAVSKMRAQVRWKKAFALLSGGVDSSVAALLALRAGLDVTGVTMRQFDDDSPARSAGEFCRAAEIDQWVFDLRDEFSKRVIDPFKAAYLRGETPNPCVLCNRTVKFGLLWDKITERFGSDDFHVITGHYARTERIAGQTALLRGSDRSKDQSYFLCLLPYARVERLLLPIGGQTKGETKEMAHELDASRGFLSKIAKKPESMEICFMQESDYRNCLAGGGRPGPILNTKGEQLGTHGGIENFTPGQRKGLGLTSREPLFVIEIKPESDTVVAATRREAMTREIRAKQVNVLADDLYREGTLLSGKIRSQAAPAPCVITRAEASHVTAVFDEPLFAPAPGQYLALYKDERLVAGGCIERAD